MKLFTSLILIISILFSWLGDLLPSHEKESAVAAISPTFIQTTPAPALPGFFVPQSGVSWDDMDYVHYDPETFYDQVDRLYTLEQQEDLTAVLALYDDLYREFTYIDTLGIIAGLHYSADVTDRYWADESLYCDDLWSETADALCQVCRHILEGPLGEDFAAHVGEQAASVYLDYEAMTDRETELRARESEIINEYIQRINTVDAEAVYEYDGREWTWEKLNAYPGDALYAKDYEGYLEVYYGLCAYVNDILGPLFIELVSIRAEMAEIMGYESYADYAYEYGYGRDFTTDDAQVLCDAVKEFAAAYYEDLYYSDLWYTLECVYPQMDETALIEVLGEYLAPFGEDLQEVWTFMEEHGLYNLCSDPNAQSGAYTTTLAFYRSPFLYVGLTGDCYDFSALTHEFGHFADSYYNPIPNVLTSMGSYDLFEIHSTGLEVLFTEYYRQIYTEGADAARFLTLAGQLENVFTGCILDEFQRHVYENPDMSLTEMNRLYADICADYGQYQSWDMDYSWVYISHNYEAPLYYISYAVSSLASLQLWDMAQTDPDAALDAYRAILAQGAYDHGYFEVLSDAGLRLFTEPGAVADICQPVLNCLEELDRKAR